MRVNILKSLMLRNKLPGKGTTIFTVMSKMAQDHGAVDLAQGYPDFEGPRELRERVAYHMDHGHNQYAPLAGVSCLRQQIAENDDTLRKAASRLVKIT